MAEKKTIKEIIQDINYGANPFVFSVKEGTYILINPSVGDSSRILSYLNLNEDISFGQDDTVAWEFNTAYSNFANNVTRFSNAPASFIYDYVKNGSTYQDNNGQQIPTPNGVVEVSQITLDTSAQNLDNNIYAIKFNAPKDVQILENGFGKNFVWCKIAFKHTIDNQEIIKFGYTKIENIINNSQKILIKDEFPKELGALQLLSPEVREKIRAVSEVGSISAASLIPNKIVLDKNIGAYVALVNTSIFNGIDALSEETIKTELKRVFNETVEKILEFEKREPKISTIVNGNEIKESFIEKYYLFGKIQENYFTPRPADPLYILISVPIRNIYAVTNPTPLGATGEILEAVLSLPSNIKEITDKISNAYNFNLADRAPALQAFIASTSPNGALANTDYLNEAYNIPAVNGFVDTILPGDARTDLYVSQTDAKDILGRNVVIKISDLEATFDRAYEILTKYSEEIAKEEAKEEAERKVIFNITLLPYAEDIKNIKQATINLLSQIGNLTDFAADSNFTLIFDKGILKKVIFNPGNGQIPVPLKYSEVYITDYYNDETINFLMTNINSIQSLSPDQKPITAFLKEYILPAELGYYEFTDPGQKLDEDSKNCQKSYKQQIKQQLKNNTNDFIVNTRLVESAKNAKALGQGEEWEKVGNSLKKFPDVFSAKRGVGVLDPYKVDWNSLITEACKCINNKEARKTVEWVLTAVKDRLLNDKPIACSIPVYQLPKLPVIKLPTIPHIPSILNIWTLQLQNTISNSSTDILRTLIKTTVESLEICKEPDSAINIGESNADDLFLGVNQQPLSNSPFSNQNDTRENRKDQFRAANILNGFENQDEVFEEIVLLLDKVSENLTKQELIELFFGRSTEKIIYLIKNIVLSLVGPPDQIPNLKLRLGFFDGETYIASNRKIIEFFTKFGSIVDPDKIIQEQQLTNDPDLLCKDPSELDQRFAESLQARGLSQEEAAAEAAKRREEIRKKLAELIEAINLLNKDSLTVPPINCVKNPDGSTTPGLLDTISEPLAFKLAREKHIETLYSPFESAYNSDIKSWFSTAIQEQPVLNTGSNEMEDNKVDFLKEFSEAFITSSAFTSANSKIGFSMPKYYFGANLDSNSENVAYLAPLDIASNAINYNIEYEVLSQETGSLLALTSSFLSNNTFSTPKLTNEENKALRTNLSLTSTYSLSSSLENLKQFSNESKELTNKHKTITKYYNSIKEKYKNSFYFTKTEDVIIKKNQDDVGKQTFSPIVKKLNFNPIPTKKDKLCKKPDIRLINNLQDIKDNINKSNNQCEQPQVNQEGKKTSPTQSDLSNYDGVINLLMRIYAIDFNLKLLPFGAKLQILQSKFYFKTCYEIFVNDLQRNFGKTFTNKILNIIATNYLSNENIELADEVQNELNLGLYNFEGFYKIFREKHFVPVNKQIVFLLNNKINEGKLNKGLVDSEDKTFIFDKKSFGNLLDYEFENINLINVANINVATPEVVQLQQEKDRLLKEYNQSLNSIADLASKTNVDGVAAIFGLAVGTDQKTQEAIRDSNLSDIIDKYPNSVAIRKARGESVGNSDGNAFRLGALILLLTNVLPNKLRISTLLNEIEKKEKQLQIPEEIVKKSFFIDTSNGNANLCLITSDTLTLKTLQDFNGSTGEKQKLLKDFLKTSIVVFSKQNVQNALTDQDIKEAFMQYFSSVIPLEEIYSSVVSSCLLSLSSVNKLNSCFMSSKKEIKNIFDVVEYASDHTKDFEDDGMTEIFSKLKVAVKIPEFMVTSVAEAIDPNVSVASKISLAYEAGVAAAAAAGIDIPVKKLPLFATSPLLFPAFLFPISPFGVPAILLSLKNINIDTDSSTVTDDDKQEKC